MKLFQCIRVPLHMKHVFDGIEQVPADVRREILFRRWREFERLSFFRHAQGGSTRIVDPMPVSIEAYVRISLETSPALLLALSQSSTNVWMTICLTLLLGIYAQYGKLYVVDALLSSIHQPKNDMLEYIYRQLHPEDSLLDSPVLEHRACRVLTANDRLEEI
jgi:hypothetical protein